jgi:repressor LexA
MTAKYTPRQGQYLAFIYHYTKLNGRPPAQADMQRYFRVFPPTVHQMVLNLEERELLARVPGEPRSLRVLLPPEKLPELESPFVPSRGQPRNPDSVGDHRRGMSDRKQVAGAPSEARALEQLREAEVATVLRTLLKNHPELAGEAETVAQSVLRGVSSDDVAETVEDAVLALCLEDLDRYPGFSRYDSFEPTEAAWWLLGEAVRPLVEDIRRRAEGGQIEAALATCVGVVLGLYRLRNCKRGEILEYAPDFPSEMAEEAVVTLRKALRAAKTTQGARQPSPALPAVFRDTAPEWADMLERCWNRPS